MKEYPYLKGLNPNQYLAATTLEGPVMVLAGAGSGKTKVLTMRIAHLINNGVSPFQILALTFTNKAAREMKERIAGMVGETDARSLWMGTFHSVFARILRVEGHHLGFPSNFSIYDAQDSLNVLKKVLKDMQLDQEIYKPKKVMGRISAYKNNLITVYAYLSNPELIEADENARMPQLGQVYQSYVETCFRNGAMDFDDLLLRTNELLTRFPSVLAKYQDRFRYILVDEYQDTNHSQYLIVKALASRFENICVVGDDAQSIYSFRGANIQNILNFKKDYPDACTVHLEQNYRSTQNIVNAANGLIEKNKKQFKKNSFSDKEHGDLIHVFRSLSDADEANYVAGKIYDERLRSQRNYSDFAILYRTNSQTRAFEDALRRKGIPYQVYGGLSFYQRKEIKDLLAYLRLLVNPDDSEALLRIINTPARGIGDTTQAKLVVAADRLGISVATLLEKLPDYAPETGLSKALLNRVNDFWTMIQSFRVQLKDQSVYDVALQVAKKSQLLSSLKADQTPEGISRLENIQEILNSIQGFVQEQIDLEDGDPSLSNYLENIALSTDTQKEEENMDKVSLMTIHLSKGLEFPTVFVVGMEEMLFPSAMSSNTLDELEEERRLLYVAMTRAEKQLYLTYAISRFQWGNISDREPSRFLSEIDPEYLYLANPSIEPRFINRSGLNPNMFGGAEEPVFRKKETPINKKTPSPLAPKNLKPIQNTLVQNTSGTSEQIEVGDRVRHERFGVGEVLELDGADPTNVKARVKFDTEGEKNLMLKFAKLSRVL